MVDNNKPYRYTRGKLSVETTLALILLGNLWRLSAWGFRRCKPVAYHPWGVVGAIVIAGLLMINPWLLLVPVLAVFAWFIGWPESYLHHVHPRWLSFLAGWRYRHRPRRKLTACALLNEKDPIPVVSHVRKIGCTTRVRIKMVHGDEIEMWRAQAPRLAQTYNALDCKVNPYRRQNFTTFRTDAFTLKPPFVRRSEFTRHPPFIRHKFTEKVIKPHWLELEFLTRDPFTKVIGPEYIHFHRDVSDVLPELGNPVGPYRSGQPHRFLVRTHKLVVAPSQRGKSNAERTMVYADAPAVEAGLVENWGCDLKRGVEIKFMENLFARTEYGLDGPAMVLRFFQDAQAVMNRRLDQIREAGEDVRHVPTSGDPALRIYIDEFLAFEDSEYADHRNDIYRAISAIQRRGAAAGVSIIAFAQDPKKDKFPLRDGFLEVEVGGGLTRTQVEMVMPGGWDAGVRTGDIDLPGVFYVRSESILTPEQFRYVHITNATIRGLRHERPQSAFELTPEEKKNIDGILIA
jgi:hypothetical protein